MVAVGRTPGPLIWGSVPAVPLPVWARLSGVAPFPVGGRLCAPVGRLTLPTDTPVMPEGLVLEVPLLVVYPPTVLLAPVRLVTRVPCLTVAVLAGSPSLVPLLSVPLAELCRLRGRVCRLPVPIAAAEPIPPLAVPLRVGGPLLG